MLRSVFFFFSFALSVDSQSKSDEDRTVLSENAPYRFQGENSLQNCILRLRKNVHDYRRNTFNQHVKRVLTVVHVCINRRLADDITSIRDENAQGIFTEKREGVFLPRVLKRLWVFNADFYPLFM